MDNTINDHLDQAINKISPVLRNYEFLIIHDGMEKEVKAKGIDAADARKSITAYFGEVDELDVRLVL